MGRARIGGGLRGGVGRGLSTDLVAGITLAAVAIPEAMGYTKIAGMPVVTGIYTVALPAAVFALLASSRHLVVGADSATAAILFAALSPLAVPGSAAYVQLAGSAALLTGALLMVARLLRLGFLADFLSRTALVGFLTGVGIQVMVSQLPDILGVHGGGGVILGVQRMATHLGETSPVTLAWSIAVLAIMLVAERISKRIPAALLVVTAGIVIAALTGGAHGSLSLIGSVPTGLPPLGLAAGPGAHLAALVAIAASLSVVILAQSAATARSFAQQYDEPLDENRDIVALAVANAVAGVSGTFPVNGSPTKTAVSDAAGARSQVAQLVAAAAAVLILLVAAGVLRWLPQAVLATVVFSIGLKLLAIRELGSLWRLRRDEFVVAILTAAVVTLAGVEPGVVCAVGLSVLDYVRRGYRPRDIIITVTSSAPLQLLPVPAQPGTDSREGLLIYRFDAPLFFANADRFATRLKALIAAAPHPVRTVVIDLSPVADIDFTAGRSLNRLFADLRAKNLRVVLTHAEDVHGLLQAYGILDTLGEGALFSTLHQALPALMTAAAERGDTPV